MTLALRLSAPRASVVAGEDVIVDLAIENAGAAPVEVPDPLANANWQPVYTLAGPGPNDVATFDFRSAVRGQPNRPLGAADASLITVGAGATWTGQLPLSRLVPVARPGRYTLSARLAWGAVDVVSNPLSLVVEPLNAIAVDVGLSNSQRVPPEIFGAWAHAGSALFQATFVEHRPDLGEIARRGVLRLGEPPAPPREVVVPWSRRSRFEDLVGWVLYRDDQGIVGVSTAGAGAAKVALPFAGDYVVRPALETRGDDVDALVVGAGGRKLALVRFSVRGLGFPPSGAGVWIADLPPGVTGAGVAAQPNQPDTRRHLALVARDGESTVVRHAVLDGLKPPAAFSEVTIDDFVPVPGAPPAVLAHDKGGARVSVLLASAGDPARCRLVELLFGPPHPQHGPATSSSILLPAAPVEARIGYHEDPEQNGYRRDWVVRCDDGVTYGRGAGGVEPVEAAGAGPAPLALLVLSQASYLLVRSAQGGFALEHL